MDKWKILQDELYHDVDKALKSRDLKLYTTLNKVWMRMIKLDMEDSQKKHEEIKKKLNMF